MKYLIPILLACCILSANLYAQFEPPHTPDLNIGDPAPPLRLREWLKGNPFTRFEKGQVYVIEFWATWCAPCRAAMPHLSELAEKYKGKVTVLGVDLFAQETVSMDKVKAFVDAQGSRMNYKVAAEDSNYMSASWIEAADDKREGIPRSYVVDQEGKFAWVGQPWQLDNILPKLVNKTWDLKKAHAKRNLDRYLDSLDMELHYKVLPYLGNNQRPGNPELAMLAINSMVIKEPRLKYSTSTAFVTFEILLKTDIDKALEYGRETIKTQGYRYPGCYPILETIDHYPDTLNFPPAIYELGAEAYQAYIDWMPYPEISDMHLLYSKMADWYARAHKKTKAIKAQKKAIEALKNKKDFSVEDLLSFESRLAQYKNM